TWEFLIAVERSFTVGAAQDDPKRESLPLDSARWLARDIVADAIHALDFVDDATGNSREQFVRKTHPVRRHAVLTFDDAERDGVIISPLIAHHANGAHGQQNSE